MTINKTMSNPFVTDEKSDPLFDFEIACKNGRLMAQSGPGLSSEEADYLQQYIKQVNRYKNIAADESYCWSLYQPPLPQATGQRNLFYRLKRRFQGIRVPAVATYGLTNKCQCGCRHCSADYHMNDSRPELESMAMQQAILEGVALGVSNVIIVGGEPLLRQDLEEILSAVPTDKAIVTIFTNGEYLSPERARQLKKANVFGLFFSIDSVDPTEHDQLRNRNSLFESCLEGIKNARAAGLYTCLSTYLTSENYSRGHLSQIMELAKEQRLDEVTFFDAIPTGKLNLGVHSYLTDKDRLKIISEVKKFRQDPSYPAVSAQTCLTSKFANSFCFAGNTQFYLSASGRFCPCDFSPLTIGCYPEESLGQLWTNLIQSRPYKQRSKVCRMQDETFRSQFIETIPKEAILPYPIQNFAKRADES